MNFVHMRRALTVAFSAAFLVTGALSVASLLQLMPDRPQVTTRSTSVAMGDQLMPDRLNGTNTDASGTVITL